MATIMAEMSMSLDGFIADPADSVDHLFGWYANGPVAVPAPNGGMTFHVSPVSATYLREEFASVTAMVAGRRTFDLTDGFAGGHPYDIPVFVVTHSMPPGWPRDDRPVTVVTDGLESAIAQARAVAGDGVVSVGAASIARQCLNAGLLDTIRINLVPVLLGRGVRLFDQLAHTPIKLENPEVVAGDGVIHLCYDVKSS